MYSYLYIRHQRVKIVSYRNTAKKVKLVVPQGLVLSPLLFKSIFKNQVACKVCMNISPTTAETIYKVTILPIFLYCSNISIGISDSYKSKLEKLQNRAPRIIKGHNGEISLLSINHVRNKRCAIEFFKCLNGLAPRMLEKHFKRLDHRKDTRGNKSNLVVPRIRTETARKAFSYQGVKIYNRLPPGLKMRTQLLDSRTDVMTLILISKEPLFCK